MGLPFMTSEVGGGRSSPKSRQKEQNQLICNSDKGDQKIQKNCGRHIWKPSMFNLTARARFRGIALGERLFRAAAEAAAEALAMKDLRRHSVQFREREAS